MNRLSLVSALLAAAASAAEADCGSNAVETTENADGTFERIHVSGPATLDVRQGQSTQVTVAAGHSVLDDLEVDISSGTLSIVVGNVELDAGDVRVDITTSRLREICSNDAIHVTLRNLTAGDLGVWARGAGSYYRLSRVSLGELTVDVRGASSFVVDGTAERQNVDISGAGSYDARALKTAITDLRLRGANSTNVWVTEQLDVDIDGPGWVTYRGDAGVRRRILGTGWVARVR